MSQPTIEPSDFADQMKLLAEQAERQIEGPAVPAPAPAPTQQEAQPAPALRRSAAAPPGLLQMLRPLVLGLEALSRATVENTLVLNRLEAAASSHDVVPRVVSEIQEKIVSKNEINQQLFDALHKELKDYKDGFIIEVLQKPLIRDLITLYDDIVEVHKQMIGLTAGLEAQPNPAVGAFVGPIKTTETNLNHLIQFLLEVLARMDVTLFTEKTGKLNKQTQRAISVEAADSEAEDGNISRSLKPGFMWRDRVLRPEEVIIKKWKEGFLVAINEPKEGNDVQEGTSDAI